MLAWYAAHARPLPWRDSATGPWGIYVSEVMSHQTPVARVEPVWRTWLDRWPTPSALAAAAPGDAVRAWDRLGYPRRALRLHEAAEVMVDQHAGRVPETVEELRALPGVGDYTAAAVACFAFGVPVPVLDVNVRRVLARAAAGVEHPAPALTAAERALGQAALPVDPDDAREWNAAAMELGALVCTARAPACTRCPLADRCAWLGAGRPAYSGPPRRVQRWEGTDRQARGAMLRVLREAPGPVPSSALAAAWPDRGQGERCLDGLVTDGLVEPIAGGRFRLPGT